MKKTHNIFTLIELLVVIAIIGVLMTLLLPALRTAKETARGIACMGNVKQVGVLYSLYADDNSEYSPSGYTSYGGTFAAGNWYFPEALALAYLGKNFPPTYKCPSYPSYDEILDSERYKRYNYGGNCVIRDSRSSSLAFPGRTLLVGEAYGGHSTVVYSSVPPTASGIAFRHSKKTNMTFLDGHAEARQGAAVPTYINYPGDWRVAYTIFWQGRIDANAVTLNELF